MFKSTLEVVFHTASKKDARRMAMRIFDLLMSQREAGVVIDPYQFQTIEDEEDAG